MVPLEAPPELLTVKVKAPLPATPPVWPCVKVPLFPFTIDKLVGTLIEKVDALLLLEAYEPAPV
jgi:hypothetical protein